VSAAVKQGRLIYRGRQSVCAAGGVVGNKNLREFVGYRRGSLSTANRGRVSRTGIQLTTGLIGQMYSDDNWYEPLFAFVPFASTINSIAEFNQYCVQSGQ
jgi:hypothetical protein